MKMAFMDYETTDLPVWGKPSGDDCQPYMVSAAVIIRDNSQVIAQYHDFIAAPVESAPKAFEAHGLTKAYLDDRGTDMVQAAKDITALVQNCDYLVAHNVNFDKRILRISIKRFLDDDTAEKVKRIPHYCTMKACKDMWGLRRYDKGGTLDDCCEKLLQMAPREGPHGALEDVNRCLALYDELVRLGHGPRPIEVDG